MFETSKRSPARQAGYGTRLLALMALAALPGVAGDVTCTWIGPVGGQWVWSATANWNCPNSGYFPDWPDRYAPNNYAAVIGSNALVTLNSNVTIGGGTLTQGLSVGANSILRIGEFSPAVLTDDSSVTTVQSLIDIRNGTLNFTGASGNHTLFGQGSIAMSSANSSIVMGSNSLINNIAITGQGSISGSHMKNLGSVWAAGGQLTMNFSTGLENYGTLRAAGTLRLQNTSVTGIWDTYSAVVLDNGGLLTLENSSISGNSLQIGSGGTLKSTSGSSSFILGAFTSFSNQGTIVAQGGDLTLDGGGQTRTNAGSIGADGNALTLTDGTFQGGTVYTANGGVIWMADSTLRQGGGAPLVISNQGTIASLSGTNAINLSAGDTFSNSGFVGAIDGSMTFDGGGQLWLNSGSLGAYQTGTLNLQSGFFRGGELRSGAFPGDTSTVILRNVQMDQASVVTQAGNSIISTGASINRLYLSQGHSFDNSGTIASTAGLLVLDGGNQTWTNNGTIKVYSAGTMVLQNGTFQGGSYLIDDTSSMNLLNANLQSIPGHSMTIQTGTPAGAWLFADGNNSISLHAGDTLTNNGAIVAQSGTLTIDGGGQTWQNNGILYSYSTGKLTLQNGTFQGGTLRAWYGNTLALNNATVSGASIDMTADSLIQAVGGDNFLNLDTSGGQTFNNLGTINAASGARMILAPQNGSTITNLGTIGGGAGTTVLLGGTFQGGTYATGTGTLELFNGPTIQSTPGHSISISVDNGATLSSQISGTARINLAAGDQFSNQGTITTFGGELVLNGGGQTWNNSGTVASNGATLTLLNGTFQGGTISTAGGSEMYLDGATLQKGPGAPLTFLNSGTVYALGAANTINLSAGDTFNNAAGIIAAVGSLTLDGGGQTWNTGYILSAQNGTLKLQNGTFNNDLLQAGYFQGDASTVSLTDATVRPTGLDIRAGNSIVGAGGNSSILLQAGGTFNNAGTISADAGSLTLDGAGQTWTNAGVIQAAGGTLHLQNGTFQGGVFRSVNGTSGPTILEGGVTLEKGATPLTIDLHGSGIYSQNGINRINLAAGDTVSIASDIHVGVGQLTIDGGGQLWDNGGSLGGYYNGKLILQHAAFRGGELKLGYYQGDTSTAELNNVNFQQGPGNPLRIITAAGNSIVSTGGTNNIFLHSGDTFDNQGVILAKSGSLALDGGGQTWNNAGTLQADQGGNLILQNGTFQGGVVSAPATNLTGSIRLRNVTLQAGPGAPLTIDNQAVYGIFADVGTSTVKLAAGDTFFNAGPTATKPVASDFDAVGGGKLILDGGGQTWNNAGNMGSAGAGSALTMKDGTFQGGTYWVGGTTPGYTGAATFNLTNATLQSVGGTPVTISSVAGSKFAGTGGNSFINLQAGDTFTNGGTITSQSGNLTIDGGGQTWANAGTIQGESSGRLYLQNGTFTGGTFTTAAGATGGIFLNGGATLQAGAGAPLTIQSLGRAISAGAGSNRINLAAGDTLVNNTDIDAFGVGTVLTIDGGGQTWTNSAGAYMGAYGRGAMVLQNGVFQGGKFFAHSSGYYAASNDSTLNLVDATLQAPPGANYGVSITPGNTIAGAGGNSAIRLQAGDAFRNLGKLSANAGTLTIDGGGQTWVSDGIYNGSFYAGAIQSNGGLLKLRNGTFQGGTVASQSNVILLDGGVTLQKSADSALTFTNNSGVYATGGSNSVLLSAGDTFQNNNNFLGSIGQLTLDGGGQTWSNSNGILGSYNVGDTTIQNGTFNGGTLRAGLYQGDTSTVRLVNATVAPATLVTLPGNSIRGELVGGSSSIELAAGATFDNQGAIVSQGGSLHLDGGGLTWNNSGSIVSNQGLMHLENGTFQGGTYATAATGGYYLQNVTLQKSATAPLVIANNGTNNFNTQGQSTIRLAAGDSFTNTTFLRVSTGTLTLNLGGQTWDQTGTISADGTSGLTLQNGTLRGGTVRSGSLATDHATVKLESVTLDQGPGVPLKIKVLAGSQLVGSSGTNKINLHAGDEFSNASLITTTAGTLTIDGGGQTWKNGGTLQADHNGQLFLKNGVFEGGTLSLPSTLTNGSIHLESGVTLQAGVGAPLTIDNHSFYGIFATAGNARVNLAAGDTFTNGLGSDFDAAFGGQMTLDGGHLTWNNAGNIGAYGAGGSVMTLQNGTFQGGTYFAGSSSNTGNATFALNNATVQAGASPMTLNTVAGSTLAGTGGTSAVMLHAGDTFSNAGTIAANAGWLTLDGGGQSWSNAGTIQANAGGKLFLQNGSFTGGTLATAVGGEMTLNNVPAVQSVITNAGALNIASSTLMSNVSGVNTGNIRVTGGTLELQNTVLSGSGYLIADFGGGILASVGSNSVGGATAINPGGSFTLATGASFTTGSLNNNGLVTVNGGILNATSFFNSDTAVLRGTTNVGSLTNIGTLTLDHGQLNATSLVVNDFGGLMTASGSINLSNGAVFANNQTLQLGGVLTVSGGPTINNGEVFIASGQSLRPAELINQGMFTLTGGAIVASGPITNFTGSVISGRGSVSGSLSNTGNVIAAGGLLTLAGPSVSNDGGVFLVDSGSTLRVTNAWSNAGEVFLTGSTSTLAGGLLSNSGVVHGTGTVGNAIANYGLILGDAGQLSFTSAGSQNPLGGTIEVDAGATVRFTLGLAQNDGKIDLLGGRFDNNSKPLTNTGNIAGYGTVATGGLTNNGSVNLGGGTQVDILGTVSNSGTIHATETQTTFFDAVTNNAGATIENTQGKMQFLGGLTNHGAYITDPADNLFTNLDITDTGYLVGGIGDRFIVSGNFTNTSTQNTLWDTDSAELTFLTGGTHSFMFAGLDMGATYLGESNNFSWGALRLGLSQSLSFLGAAGRGQYIGSLILDGGLSDLAAIHSNGLNLYYNPSSAGNGYLGGLTYQLNGGGILAPTATPEPGTMLLIGLGLAAIGWRARRAG